MTDSQLPLIAVDVGNSRVKLGRFDSLETAAGQLPAPTATLELGADAAELAHIGPWLGTSSGPWLGTSSGPWLGTSGGPWLGTSGSMSGSAAGDFRWYIGSVQRSVSSTLIDWLRAQDARHITLLASFDLPLHVTLPRPDMVGIDRLLGALAANRLRHPQRPAIIVDLGTAITVDLVDAAGSFAGGAILPGIGLSARALHAFTDLLPELDMQGLAEPPAALGTDTIAAMRAGIYWGAVGGVRQLIELLARPLPRPPQVFLSGGAAPAVAHLIAADAQYQAHLVLAGIALTAAHARS